MNSESFTYWLQGFVELSDTDTISEKQWLMIKDHLKLVFDKVTPVRTPDRTEFNPIRSPNYQEVIDALRPKPVDLIGKQFDSTFWINNPPAITC